MSKEKEISEMRSLFLANKGFTVLLFILQFGLFFYYYWMDCFAFARNDVVFTLSPCERVEFLNERSEFRNSGEGCTGVQDYDVTLY